MSSFIMIKDQGVIWNNECTMYNVVQCNAVYNEGEVSPLKISDQLTVKDVLVDIWTTEVIHHI